MSDKSKKKENKQDKKNERSKVSGSKVMKEVETIGKKPTSKGIGESSKTAKKTIITARKEVEESINAAKKAGLAALARSIADKNSLSFKTQNVLEKKCKEEKMAIDTTRRKGAEVCSIVQGVYFKCPALGPEILTKDEWKQKLKNFLNDLMNIDKSVASCMMIHSLNQQSDSVKCIETLCLILQNIISNPLEEKFRKIRISNQTFQEKVIKVIGAVEFLESVGFEKCSIESVSDTEDYYIFKNDIDNSYVQQLIDLLNETVPITLELHRDIKVLKHSQLMEKIEFPDDFYSRTQEDIKREQQRRLEILENSKILKTKEMREKEKQNKVSCYRYTVIRIRFPDGVCLQGTFGVYETIKVVKQFVRECIDSSIGPFKLTSAFGIPLKETEDDKTLDELDLVPAVLMTFMPLKPLPSGKYFLSPDLLKTIKSER